MKVVVIYLLFLFSLLLKTDDNVYAGVQYNSTHYSQTQHTQKAAKAQLGSVEGRHFIKRNTVLIEEKEFFGIENEDETLAFSRKDVLLIDSSVIIVYASILFFFYYYQKKRLPFCKHFSYTASHKYILQRTLRI